MAVVNRAIGTTVLGVTTVACTAGSCFASGGFPDLSKPVAWALLAGAVGSALASGFQLKGLFDEKAATKAELRADGGRTRSQMAEGFGDVQAKLERMEALIEAFASQDQGGGAEPSVQNDPQVLAQIAAVAESQEPSIRAAVDEAVRGGGAHAIERTEDALLAAIASNRQEGAARHRELGALQSLYSVAKAIETYQEALRLDPDDFWTRVLLRRLLSSAHRTDRAFEVATVLYDATRAGGWERSVACDETGDVLRARNDLAGALERYEEGLKIRRDLAASDPTNMMLRRDVWASLWRLAPLGADPIAGWAEVVGELTAMRDEGVLLPSDEGFIETARANLAAARAATGSS